MLWVILLGIRCILRASGLDGVHLAQVGFCRRCYYSLPLKDIKHYIIHIQLGLSLLNLISCPRQISKYSTAQASHNSYIPEVTTVLFEAHLIHSFELLILVQTLPVQLMLRQPF